MRRIYALLVAMLLVMSTMVLSAAASSTMLDPFTADELNDNWGGNRRFPTGGVSSVTAFGRSDVARIGIDSSETASGGFNRTEGIKTSSGDFGLAVQADLYLDPAWEGNAVRAGLWVVGDNGDGERDQLFGIIDFINADECDDCTSHSDNAPDEVFQGFRIWDSTVGWTENLDTEFEFGKWVTLSITLDPAEGQYVYAIDGETVGTATGGEHFIREVFLNSYNYGNDTFQALDNIDYEVHWHNGDVASPSSSRSSSEPDEAAGDSTETEDGDEIIVSTDDDSHTIRHLTTTPVDPNNPPPAGLSFPHGLISFDIADVEPGACVDVTIQLPGPAQEYWKFQNGEWFQMDATFSGNSVTFQLCDGGVGDASGEANGYIIDPGGPAVRASFTG